MQIPEGFLISFYFSLATAACKVFETRLARNKNASSVREEPES
jgi:hypothetical protein